MSTLVFTGVLDSFPAGKVFVAFDGAGLSFEPLFHYACLQFWSDRGNEIMSHPFKLEVAVRDQTGRSASRRIRQAGRIPAVLYGKHTKPETLSIESREFSRLLKSVGDRAILVELHREDVPVQALSILQEIQRDRITDRFLHVDLHEVKPDEKFDIRVPLRLVGESFGVKNQRGVLEINTHLLRIRVLPKDLPETITIDVTEMKVGETIKVGGLRPHPGAEFLDAAGQPLVSCVEPVAEVVEGTAATVPVEGAVAVPGAAPTEGTGVAPPAAAAKGAAAPPAKK